MLLWSALYKHSLILLKPTEGKKTVLNYKVLYDKDSDRFCLSLITGLNPPRWLEVYEWATGGDSNNTTPGQQWGSLVDTGLTR